MTTTPGWNYEKPTEQSLMAEFAKSMGADAATNVWAVVCRSLGLTRPVTRLEDLIRASEAMINIGDETRVAGRGALILLITYRALEVPVTTPSRPYRAETTQ